MNTATRRLGLVALAGLTLAGAAAPSGMAKANASSSIQCGVATSSQGAMMTMEGAILSPTKLTGEYSFRVRSQGKGGSSNISQGGMFSASANQVTTLGQVTVNAGAKVTIDFEITSDGHKLDCSKDSLSQN